jgi:DNA-binding beta-propeller fold protein YncE
MKSTTTALALLLTLIAPGAWSQEMPLLLERKIPLGEVRGRIDHLAVDLKRNRLFVAELENDTVAVVDLDRHKLLQVISGLKRPQGLGYHAATDSLYAANGGDGTVTVFRGDDYRAVTQIALGDDADNVRVDAAANRIIVGYGEGALAVIDPASLSKVGDIKLKAHPESFQLDRSTSRIFVNDPTNQAIVVVDRVTGREVAAWPTGNNSNFPMALHEAAAHILVALRNPARLAAFSMHDGVSVANVELCADADDLFVDAKRGRVYVSCGDGYVDVFDGRGNGYRRMAHIATAGGARTSLFVAELDLLFVAARAGAAQGATLWVFRPGYANEASP